VSKQRCYVRSVSATRIYDYGTKDREREASCVMAEATVVAKLVLYTRHVSRHFFALGSREFTRVSVFPSMFTQEAQLSHRGRAYFV